MKNLINILSRALQGQEADDEAAVNEAADNTKELAAAKKKKVDHEKVREIIEQIIQHYGHLVDEDDSIITHQVRNGIHELVENYNTRYSQ